jgi:hypothetical protein
LPTNVIPDYLRKRFSNATHRSDDVLNSLRLFGSLSRQLHDLRIELLDHFGEGVYANLNPRFIVFCGRLLRGDDRLDLRDLLIERRHPLLLRLSLIILSGFERCRQGRLGTQLLAGHTLGDFPLDDVTGNRIDRIAFEISGFCLPVRTRERRHPDEREECHAHHSDEDYESFAKLRHRSPGSAQVWRRFETQPGLTQLVVP